MNVSLTPELEEVVNEKARSGLYNSASEVIREALRLLIENDRMKQVQLKAVRTKIDRGIEQLDRGEGIPASAAINRLGVNRRART